MSEYIIVNRIDLREALNIILSSGIKINKVSFYNDEAKIYVDDIERVKNMLDDKVKFR